MRSNSTFTKSYTYSFTKLRLDVVGDQFGLFFKYSGMNSNDIHKHLQSIKNYELQAVGVYLEQNGYCIAEVELNVDWNVHHENVRISGSVFDTDIPGWKNGAAPEAWVAVHRLVNAASWMNLHIKRWIRVSSFVRNDPYRHKQVCNKLGYNYGSYVAPWKTRPSEQSRQIQWFEEGRVITREA